jgi:hypothetical protein
MQRRWMMGAALAIAVAAAACSTQEGEYVGDADSGAAAPATRLDDTARTPADSNTGNNPQLGTGRPGIAGDPTGRSDQGESVSADSIIRRQREVGARDTTSGRSGRP